jgi:hypothetical protein
VAKSAVTDDTKRTNPVIVLAAVGGSVLALAACFIAFVVYRQKNKIARLEELNLAPLLLASETGSGMADPMKSHGRWHGRSATHTCDATAQMVEIRRQEHSVMIYPCNECGEIKGLMQKDASFCMMCGAPASQGIVVPKVSRRR